MELDYGIYQAIVTDNSTFYNTGKIKVRIQKFYNQPLDWDLSSVYNANTFNKDLMDDIDALVHTPIGGGNNYGLFALPQVNSVGLVQFLGGNIHVPVWMGSFFRPEYDKDGKLIRCNVPNDQPEYEGMGSDGIIKGRNDPIATKKTKGGDGTIILRSKSTKGPGVEKKKDNMDFHKNRSENLVVLSEDEVKIIHFSKWNDKDGGNGADLEQYEEITVGTNKEYGPNNVVVKEYPQIDIKVVDKNNDEKNKQTTGIKVNPDEVSLEVTSNKLKMKSSISSTPRGILIKSQNTDNENITTFKMNPTQVTIINKNVSVVVNQNDAIISAPEGKVRLSGKEVVLGDGGGYVLVRDTPMLPFRTEDGSVIKTTNVRA
jgi:hypothetical protein